MCRDRESTNTKITNTNTDTDTDSNNNNNTMKVWVLPLRGKDFSCERMPSCSSCGQARMQARKAWLFCYVCLLCLGYCCYVCISVLCLFYLLVVSVFLCWSGRPGCAAPAPCRGRPPGCPQYDKI